METLLIYQAQWLYPLEIKFNLKLDKWLEETSVAAFNAKAGTNLLSFV